MHAMKIIVVIILIAAVIDYAIILAVTISAVIC